MIKLDKGPKPGVLAANEVAWAAEYAAFRSKVPGTSPAAETRYKTPAIKAAVTAEACGKCIYCESAFTASYPGDVEHIIPKSHSPDLVVTWENLGFVCSVCNNRKRDRYDPACPTINPFADEPNDFLQWAGPFCSPKDGAARGVVTISVVGLDRENLVLDRARRMKYIDGLITTYHRETVPAVKEAILDTIRHETERDTEYSAAMKSFVRLRLPSLIG